MAGKDYVDEIDCGNFFDQIDDLIEFPPVGDTGLSSDFPNVWDDNSGELQDSDPILSGYDSHHSASDLSAQLAVPYEDIVQLEWLSNFVEDSFSGGGMTLNKENIPIRNEVPTVPHSHFQTSSPVSVLESSSSSSSSSSCSGSGSVGKKMVPLGQTQRARSKRPRPATFNPRPSFDVISPQPSFIETPTFFVPVASLDLDSFVEPKKKKKKIKKPVPLTDSEDQKQNPAAQQGVRKCMHCEITKTPQWRAGPLGPKTLCNACGVRYKSGRLFPEYRPAASPTFVPAIHSNSHKKVLEMRTKGGEKAPSFVDNAACLEPEQILIPNSVEYMACV